MRSQPLASLALCCSLLALAGCGAANSSGTGTSATGTTATTTRPTGPTEPRGGKLGPEGLPVERGTALAPASTTTPGGPVDGIRCPQHEQLAYHIHVHLQVYANGQPRQLPGGIGVVQAVAEPTQYGHLYAATRCYYWLHTHAADGVIHVESPITTIYTLGEFFDEWRQPLNQSTVATASGPVTAYVNGKRWTKSVRAIPLRPHAVIQLDVGRPLAPFHNLSFGRTGL